LIQLKESTHDWKTDFNKTWIEKHDYLFKLEEDSLIINVKKSPYKVFEMEINEISEAI